MSGVETLALLGAISSVITIIETSQKVYSAARSLNGLHQSFRRVAGSIPLILQILQEAESTQEQATRELTNTEDASVRKAIEDKSRAVQPVIASCRTNVEAIRKIFESVVPSDGASRFQRYKKAIKSADPGKQRKVQDAYKDTLEKLQMLHSHQVWKSQAKLEELTIAMGQRSSTSVSSPAEARPTTEPAVEASNVTEQETSSASIKAASPPTPPSMTWQNFNGSKVMNQGSQTIHGDQIITF